MAWPTLIYDHVATNPIIISERHARHSHLITNVRMAHHLHSTMQGTNPPCRKALHLHLTTNVRKDQHLYLTMQGTNPSCWKGSALTSKNQCQKGSALTSDHVGTNPTVTSEWPSVPNWAFLVTDQVPPFKEWQQPIYLIKWEHIPQSH